MFIHDFTVKICRQTLNTKKGDSYIYKVEEPEFKEMTTDQLNHLYLEAQAIEARIQTMLQLRG